MNSKVGIFSGSSGSKSTNATLDAVTCGNKTVDSFEGITNKLTCNQRENCYILQEKQRISLKQGHREAYWAPGLGAEGGPLLSKSPEILLVNALLL